MLDAGVAHCDVTKQDVRNADAIFGSSIAALKGKTHNLASTPASAVIAPRVVALRSRAKMKVGELSVVSLGWFCATRAKKAKLDTKVGRLLLKRNLNV